MALLETYIKYNASVGTILHPMTNTNPPAGYDAPRSWARQKDWQALSEWSGNYSAKNTQKDVWRLLIQETFDIKPGDRIHCGHDTQGTDVGQTDTLYRVDIDGTTVHTHTFENQLNDIHVYTVQGTDIKPEPLYLERLSQLANNSRAVTRNSKSL